MAALSLRIPCVRHPVSGLRRCTYRRDHGGVARGPNRLQALPRTAACEDDGGGPRERDERKEDSRAGPISDGWARWAGLPRLELFAGRVRGASRGTRPLTGAL